jgi:hypothetical protein
MTNEYGEVRVHAFEHRSESGRWLIPVTVVYGVDC